MEIFAPYRWALVALAVYAVVGSTLGALSAIRKDKRGMAPGATHAPDYANPDYRLDRTYMNTQEMLAFVAPVILCAVLAGVGALWVNLAALGMLAARIAFVVVYLRGVGRGYGGLRTNIVIVHNILLTGLALAVVAVALF